MGLALDAYITNAATLALAGVGTFLRESAADANLSTFADPLPVIVFGDYTTSQQRAESRVSAAQLTLYFADARPGQGDDPVAHQAAVARMEALKARFLQALDAYPLAQIEAIRSTPFAGAYAAELDGVGVQFTLTVPAMPVIACLVAVPVVPTQPSQPAPPTTTPTPAPATTYATSTYATSTYA